MTLKQLLPAIKMKKMISRFEQLDQYIGEHMILLGIPAIRISFAIIFSWFGILKPLDLSPAIPLVKATVVWLPVFSVG